MLGIYAVVDASGVVLNRIVVDATAADTYWPGYGFGLVYLAEAPSDGLPLSATGSGERSAAHPDDFAVIALEVDPSVRIGDTINLTTGEITPRPDPPPPEPEFKPGPRRDVDGD